MNEINFIYFAKQSDSSYSRGVAHKAIRDYTSKLKPQYISEVAYNVLGCKPISYNDMKRNSNSSECVWEHTIPVNTLFKNIVLHDMSLHEIESYLDSTIISIVSSSEDSALTLNGFRDSRDNWLAAYTESNIKLTAYDEDLEFYKKFYESYFIDESNNPQEYIVEKVLNSIDFIKQGQYNQNTALVASQLKDIFARYVELTGEFANIKPFDFSKDVRKTYPIKRYGYGRVFEGLYIDLTDSKDVKDYLQCFTDEKLEQLDYAWQTENNGLE